MNSEFEESAAEQHKTSKQAKNQHTQMGKLKGQRVIEQKKAGNEVNAAEQPLIELFGPKRKWKEKEERGGW